MRRLTCIGCGLSEDLNDPSGNIHTMQLLDLTPPYTPSGGPDKPIQEDLCKACRDKVRRHFFGELEDELLDMPMMRGT